MKTPFELWNNKPPSLIHLRTFGCKVQAHHKSNKVDPRSVIGLFMSFQSNIKVYKLVFKDSSIQTINSFSVEMWCSLKMNFLVS